MDGEMDWEGNACVQTLPDTNSVSLLLNYGIIFLSVPYYQGLEGGGGVGGGPYPALLHPIQFLSLSLYPAPPMGLEGGVGIWHFRLECCLSFPKYIY